MSNLIALYTGGWTLEDWQVIWASTFKPFFAVNTLYDEDFDIYDRWVCVGPLQTRWRKGGESHGMFTSG